MFKKPNIESSDTRLLYITLLILVGILFSTNLITSGHAYDSQATKDEPKLGSSGITSVSMLQKPRSISVNPEQPIDKRIGESKVLSAVIGNEGAEIAEQLNLTTRSSSLLDGLPNSTSASDYVVPQNRATLSLSGGCITPKPTEVGSADCDTAIYEDPVTPNAIGSRTPIILIHGIHGNRWPDDSSNRGVDDPRGNPYPDYFRNLLNYFSSVSSTTNFQQKYKVYRFHYKSDKFTVREIARSLRNNLDALIKADSNFDKKFIIIAHSMGGLVAREYIAEYDHDAGSYIGKKAGERTIKLITLATPHHGTPLASDKARVNGWSSPVWGYVTNKLDDKYWTGNGCSACKDDATLPNRSDLRWDNFDGQWNSNLGYLQNYSTEKNGFLQGLGTDHTYDHLIYTYSGYIGCTSDVTSLGQMSAYTFGNTLEEYANNGGVSFSHLGLVATGVFAQRIKSNDFSTNINNLNNDGFVPVESANFDGHNVAKRVQCIGYDHLYMKDGYSSACDNGMTLFASVGSDLELAGITPTYRVLDVNPGSWNYGNDLINTPQTHVFTLLNTGNATLHISGTTISGTNGDQFSSTNTPFDISPNGSKQLVITFRPTTVGAKTAVLNILNNSVNAPTKSVTLTGNSIQSSCSYSLPVSARSFSPGGGSGSFTISAGNGCVWTASTDYSWITVNSGANGAGTQTVSYSVPPNSVSFRSGIITVRGGSTTLTFTISEDANINVCSYSLSTNYVSFGSGSGSDTVNVIAPSNCFWSTISDSPWLALNTPGLHAGTFPISFSVGSSSANSVRLGTITILGQGSTQVLTVSQDAISNGCTYSLSPSEQSMPVPGGQNNFSISTGAGCPWQVSTPDRWISINSTNNGSGSRTIGYTVGSNGSSSVRLGSISIQTAGVSPLLLTVRQDGVPIVYPNVSLPNNNLQMGDALVNSTIYQGIVINNTGLGYLFLGSVYLSAGSSDFDVLPNAQNQGIAPGGSTSVSIKLTPTSTGVRSATFSFSSNDPNNPTSSFSVSGNGVTQITGGNDFVWSNKITLPSDVDRFIGAASAVINNNIYVFGGGFFKRVYKYDPTTNGWSRLSDAPDGLDYGGAAVLNGKIYVIGDPFVNKMQIYDPIHDSWSEGATLPSPRFGFTVAAVNGKVYIIGGTADMGGGGASTLVQEYDPSANTFTTKASMPTPRAYAAISVVNNLIYVMGGQGDGGIRSGATEVFDPSANSWSTRQNDPTRRASDSAVSLNNKIEVIGGSQGGPDAIDLVEEHDPSLPGNFGTWFQRNHIITGRANFVTGVVNGKVYVIGGRASDGSSVTTVEEGVLAASPKMNLPVTSFSCGDIPVGGICEKRIEVQNLGNALLTVTSYGRTSGGSDFQYFRNYSTVAAGDSATFVERFVPTATGSQTATYQITANDPKTPTVTFSLSGNGVAATLENGNWQVVRNIPLSNGNRPRFIAVNGGKAYVTRGGGIVGGQRVGVLDLASGTAIAEIPINAFSNANTGYIAARGNRAYVSLSNLGSNGQLAVVNTDTNSVIGYVPVGADPWGVATSGNKVYVSNLVWWTNGDPATVQVVDAGTNTVTTTIPVGRSAEQIVVDESAGRAYVANFGDGIPEMSTSQLFKSVSVFDTTTNGIVGTIPMLYHPNSLALAGNRLYVCTGASVEVVDLSSSQVIASIPMPDSSFGIAATSEFVFVINNGSHKIIVIKIATNAVVGSVDLDDPVGITVDPATNLVYVVNGNSQTIKVLRFISPGFSVSTNSQSLAATAGGNTAFNTTVTSIDGFAGAVNLGCEGLPTGATCQFGQNPVNVLANNSVTTGLTVNVPPGTVSGSYNLRVVGNGTVSQSLPSNTKVGTAAVVNTPLSDFQNLSLTVPSCDLSLATQNVSVGTAASNGSVNVLGTTGCSWTGVSNVSWISITSGASGNGNGTVNYSISANTDPTPRVGTLTVAGQTFTVNQAAAIFTISGVISDSNGNGIVGTTVSLNGSQSAQTDNSGNYSFQNLPIGNYVVTPSKSGYAFNPASQSFNNLNADQTANFTGGLVPVITTLNPNFVIKGGLAFSLVVNGTGFMNNSVVRLNGSDRATSFNSSQKLTATILDTDILNEGTVTITVFNPGPGGISAGATLTIASFKSGDVNGDNVVNVGDLVAMANILAGNTQPTPTQKAAADVFQDGTGKINIQDLFTLANWLAGNIKTLPVIANQPNLFQPNRKSAQQILQELRDH